MAEYEDQEEMNQDGEKGQEGEPKRKTKDKSLYKVIQFIGMDNIAEDESIEKGTLDDIGMKVVEDYQTDEDSRSEWLEQNEKAVEIAKQVVKTKTFPWPNASNVKYPLISEAALSFNSRAYPQIIKDDKVVKIKVQGDDPNKEKEKRADRISDHMSWQLMEGIPNWETDTDKMTIMLPIIGTMFTS